MLFFAAGLFLLSLITALYFEIKPSVEYQQKQLQRYVNRQQEDAAGLLGDTVLLRKLVLQTETPDEFARIEGKDFDFFLFAETLSDNQDLLFWNNQKILPPAKDFALRDGEYFQHLVNGYYIVQKKALQFSGMSNKVVAFVMIPILDEYYLQTSYLETRFAHDKDAARKVAISPVPTEFEVRSSVTGKPLLYLKRVTHSNMVVTDPVTIVLRLIALLLVLFYLHGIAESLAKKDRVLHGTLFIFGSLLLIRGIMYLFPQVFSFRQFELFDPLVYATNSLNRSLGDLLINAVFLCWVVLFTWYNAGPFRRVPAFLKGNSSYVAAVIATFFLIFSTFELANVVRGLVINSKISFNVTDFFSLDVYTVVGLIVLALLSLAYYYFTRLLLNFIFTVFKEQPVYVYFTIAFIGLIFLTFRTGNEIILFHLPVLLWLVIYTLLVTQETFIINRFRATVAGLLFWIFVFSISLAAIIIQGNRENELRVRKAIAEKFDQVSNTSLEPTLSVAISNLNNRFLLKNFNRFYDDEQNRQLRDSILRENILGYRNRYDTRLYVFDSLNHPVHNDDPATFAELNTIYTLQSKPTKNPDIYFHEASFDKFSYVTRRVIRDEASVFGTFFIVSTPKQYSSSDALYPELFRQVNRNDPENSPYYSYAIYIDNILKTASNKYPFQVTLTRDQVPKEEYDRKENNGYDELWYKASNSKIIVVAKKRDTVLEGITLFSYLFCAFLFMLGLLQLVATIFKVLSNPRETNFFSQLTIRTQIHGTVIFISVLSFLIIGAATISFFIGRYNRNNEDRLSRTAGIMVREMQKRLKEFNVSSDSTLVADSAAVFNLQKLVNEMAEIHYTDVNIYDLNGNLEVSSEGEVYRKGILSTKMHPLAYYHLRNLREIQRVQKERVSSLDYLSIYTAVRDAKSGEVRNYINIPYFSSQIDLNQEISNFLVTIINLNAFIFLIAGIIALFITNKITQTFSVIGDKMRAITLGRTNEEIVWTKNDEIGDLVKQYNKMVHELEQSAEALAKSEREGAWREMARQVAHEIKNPLTPMKLSIQYLQRAINNNQANVKELTTNVAHTLIEQIDHLSKIAADFSQFANIGNKKIELVDLHAIIGSLVELYQANPKVEIAWEKVQGSIVLKADKTQMNRLFTNLLANAVDACEEMTSCKIRIEESRKDGYGIIQIIDNGEGIPEEIQSKIFIPNFTTKTSGTGLGLAMCKSIVEQSQGHIWFETEPGKGTRFFVQLPIIG